MEGKHKPFMERQHHRGDGFQKIYRFENYFGASVIRTPRSYGGEEGLWELAVLAFDRDGKYDIAYDTPITSDVEGYLTDAEVEALLDKIAALAAAEQS